MPCFPGSFNTMDIQAIQVVQGMECGLGTYSLTMVISFQPRGKVALTHVVQSYSEMRVVRKQSRIEEREWLVKESGKILYETSCDTHDDDETKGTKLLPIKPFPS